MDAALPKSTARPRQPTDHRCVRTNVHYYVALHGRNGDSEIQLVAATAAGTIDVMIPPFVPAPPLPESLAGELSVRDVTVADADELYQLVAGHERSVIGTTIASKEEMVADLTTDSALASTTQAVIVRGGTIIAGPWINEVHPDHLIFDIAMSPTIDRAEASALFAWGSRWADESAHAALTGDVAKVQLGAWCHEADSERHGWLAAAGYDQVRAFIMMRRDFTDDEVFPEPAAGVVVRQANIDPTSPSMGEAALVHQIISTSFEDHFNYTPTTFDLWWQRRADDAGFDPALWFLAELDGQPVGAMLMNRGNPKELNAGYVHYLGTLRAGRGRGVAKALLWQAFSTNRDEGLGGTTLFVDAESPTGATALYQSVGMVRERAMLDWQKWIPTA